jgi:hypothetical protein
MKFAAEIRTPGRGIPRGIRSVEEALDVIDVRLTPDLSKLPRWKFARALLLEASRTGKSRDLSTAIRQLREALRAEHWLVDV